MKSIGGTIIVGILLFAGFADAQQSRFRLLRDNFVAARVEINNRLQELERLGVNGKEVHRDFNERLQNDLDFVINSADEAIHVLKVLIKYSEEDLRGFEEKKKLGIISDVYYGRAVQQLETRISELKAEIEKEQELKRDYKTWKQAWAAQARRHQRKLGFLGQCASKDRQRLQKLLANKSASVTLDSKFVHPGDQNVAKYSLPRLGESSDGEKNIVAVMVIVRSFTPDTAVIPSWKTRYTLLTGKGNLGLVDGASQSFEAPDMEGEYEVRVYLNDDHCGLSMLGAKASFSVVSRKRCQDDGLSGHIECRVTDKIK